MKSENVELHFKFHSIAFLIGICGRFSSSSKDFALTLKNYYINSFCNVVDIYSYKQLNGFKPIVSCFY
ncbi:hypothetical protein BLOT_006374 [Blomia tropicalis]|nr:hypothetical protein BLOT_006374 [Blomia tropicalis]